MHIQAAMNLKHLFSRHTINNVSSLRFGARVSILTPIPSCTFRNASSLSSSLSPFILSPSSDASSLYRKSQYLMISISFFSRYFNSGIQAKLNHLGSESELDSDDSEDDGTMNEFLSRFVWIMRGKLSEVYPECDKKTIDSMLLIIVGKVVAEMEKGGLAQMLGEAESASSQDFSEDLWRTVWEVSNLVSDDMQKAKKKEKMKEFLQSEEVKDMCRFAGEVGIRGDMLRELRFKWAREKLEESEFYQGLERIRREEAGARQAEDETVRKNSETMDEGALGDDSLMAVEKPTVVTLPTRRGKIRYQIYGLDLSDAKWAEVAFKIHESGEVIWPQDPKPISGRCKLITERILSLQQEDDPSPLLAEWIELLQPSRIDWITLLDRLKEVNSGLYLKVAELVLGVESFQTNVRDYSKLIDSHAKENRLGDAERILKKMNENGILPDILTFTIMVHMYSKAGNLDQAKEAFESLKSYGFQPDIRVYNSMIMAYVNAGQPKSGESLMREMEARDVKPTMEIYVALLRSFSQRGDVSGATRIDTTMQFAGFQRNLESYTLLVEAYRQSGDPDQARNLFDQMISFGHKPDDRCSASMIAAYEKKNLLDKALNLLLQLEKNGFEPGVDTYGILVDWLGKLQLIDEVEEVIGKIAEQGETPAVGVHISLCDMYSRAGIEKKALQTLGVLEAKKDQLGPQEFERIITSLVAGGFVQDARRIHGLMEAQGFPAPESLKVTLMASQAFDRKRPAR